MSTKMAQLTGDHASQYKKLTPSLNRSQYTTKDSPDREYKRGKKKKKRRERKIIPQ